MDTYRSTDSFYLRRIANQIMLFPMGAKADELQGAIVIDEMAEFIWTELKQPKSFSELITIINKQYDVGNEDISPSIMDLLDFFLTYGVVTKGTCM